MLPTRVGLAGHAFREYDAARLLGFAQELGVHGLDYWPWNRGELPEREFRLLAESRHISIYCVNVPGAVARVADPSGGDHAAEAIIAAMDQAVVLGAELVQVYSAVPPAEDLVAAARALAESVRPLVAEAASRGLTLVVENNLDQRGEDARRLNPSRTPEALKLAAEIVDSDHFRVCYDPCNFVAVGVEEYPLAYEMLKPYLANVHLKDCRRFVAPLHADDPAAAKLFVDSQEGAFLPTALGAGAVSWAQIIERITHDGYPGWVTLDPFIADELLEGWCLDAARWVSERFTRTPLPSAS